MLAKQTGYIIKTKLPDPVQKEKSEKQNVSENAQSKTVRKKCQRTTRKWQ